MHYLCAAGDRARLLYLNREAIHYYEDALGRLGTAVVNRPRRAEVLASLGSALEVLSEDEAAMDNLRAALDLEQRLDVRADLWRQIAEIHRRRGNYAAAAGRPRSRRSLSGGRRQRGPACARAHRPGDAGHRTRRRRRSPHAWRAGHRRCSIGQDSVDLDRAAAYRAVGIAAAREDDLPERA